MKENQNHGNRNRSTRSETRQQEINLNAAEKIRKFKEQQKEFLRAKGNADPNGRSLAENRGHVQQGTGSRGHLGHSEADTPQDQKRKGKSLPVLSNGRVSNQVVARSRI